ncbi:MAG: hypothetical protein QOE76_2623, partial [Frankiales bacterium]|nr:hypothetical protein [Frankiales bacterium]
MTVTGDLDHGPIRTFKYRRGRVTQ